MMLKTLLSTFDMSGCLYTFALYNIPMNFNSSTARISSPKYIPIDFSTKLNLESSRWDMKFPNIYSFAEYIQWRLDPHWGFYIIHVVSPTNSILTSSSLLRLVPVKSWSMLVISMPSPYHTRDSVTLGSKQIWYAFLAIMSMSSYIRWGISRVSTGSGENFL